ncbi:MAG: diguanylate cyclase [Paracoccaceae bacterium]|nr:diguanylate cyclase [Paracoccaceae bacterium]
MMVDASVLTKFCPMHVILDADGNIVSVGPTLTKLRIEETLVGARFLDVFELSRPRAITTMRGLLDSAGRKLHMRFRDAPRTPIKGLLVPDGQGGAVINLSFGIAIVDAVRDYALTSADFAPTDLAVEMLYLVEAKSAAMESSRTLNKRLQSAMIAAEERAFSDTLTGLRNRRALDHVLDRYLDNQQAFALMHIDLDYFKEVNDTHGHAAGDEVLQQVARIMVDETRKDDTSIRMGGDEFVIILSDLRDRRRLSELAERLIYRFERPIAFGKVTLRISASVGITISDGAEEDVAAVMEKADAALYAAKRAGRAQYQFYEDALLEDMSK